MENKNELNISRLVKAPREMVFKAWTEPRKLAKWWGPKDFTNPVCMIDLKPGGALRIDMKGPDGTIYPMDGTFHEIAEPEKLVFTSVALDENREPVMEVLTTVLFEEQDKKTKLMLNARLTAVTNKEKADLYLSGMEEGWSQSLDRLEAILTNLEELVK